MPELPEVETIRQGLNQVTLGQGIEGGDVLLQRTIAHPFSASEFLAALQGAHIVQWHRRGKYLLAELGRPANPPAIRSNAHPPSPGSSLQTAAGWLGVHLRMTGQLLWVHQHEPLQKHCRVRLFLSHQRELRFVDQRTFGQLWWVPPDRPPSEIISGLATLGPEPFSPEFSVSYFQEKLRDRQRPIKNALLDQTLVAGIGNIYADEALFLSHIKPETPCARLTTDQIQQLHAAILKVLQDSIDARGTTFSDYRDISGINGNYGGIAWVYDREGQACRVCQTLIVRVKMAGRSAHFCPTCQH